MTFRDLVEESYNHFFRGEKIDLDELTKGYWFIHSVGGTGKMWFLGRITSTRWVLHPHHGPYLLMNNVAVECGEDSFFRVGDRKPIGLYPDHDPYKTMRFFRSDPRKLMTFSRRGIEHDFS